jgi:hypothetical protein
MYRVEKLGLALLLALGVAFGAAQDTAQPVDPLTPAPEVAEPAPEIPDVAWVRLAHFSPNAPEMSVVFTPTDEEMAATFTADQFEPIGYQSFTEYVEVPAGNYTVAAEGVEGELEEELSFARGNYYTVAAMGLVLPAEAQAAEAEDEDEEDGGFVAFFQNLFGNGGGEQRDRLALQLQLFEDDLTRVPNEGETLVRIVHAAPGTEPVDLAVGEEQGTLVNDVEFGNASRYATYEGGMEDLEVRLSGSRAATLTLEALNLQTGNLNTIYVVGTPVEEAPITTLGSSIAPVQAGMAAGEDVAAQGAETTETAGGGAGEEGEAAEETEEEPATEEAEPAEPETEEAEPAEPETEEGEPVEPEQPETEEPATEETEPAGD